MIIQTIEDLKKYLKDYNFVYFLFISFCLGSFFINFSILICLLIFVIKFKLIKIYIDQFKVIFYLSIFFWVILFISSIINSTEDLKNIFKSFAYIRFIILPLVIIYMLERVNKKKFIVFINAIIFFLIFDILFQFHFKVDIFGYKLENLGNPRMDRISGFFGDELVAGTYLSLFGFTALFLLKELKQFQNKLFLFLYLILIISAIIITGDRIGILFIVGILLFNFIFNKKLRKFFVISSLVFVLVGTFLIKSNEKLSYRYIENINSITGTNVFNNPTYKSFLNTPWISHYLVSLEMIKDKSFLGFGYKGFRKYCNQYADLEKRSSYKYKCTSHPHNTYFEIIVETGFLGLFLFIFFNLLIFVKVLKSKSQIILLLYSVIFTILNPFRPSGSFFTTWNAGIFWMLIGILMYYLFVNQNNEKNKDLNS